MATRLATTWTAQGALPRTFAYDGENRPLTITQARHVTCFAYAPDGERAQKAFGWHHLLLLGSDAELLVDPANPSGLITSISTRM